MNEHQRDLSALLAATGETCLAGGTRASVTPGKRIPKKKKNIKSLNFSPLRKDPIPNHDKKLWDSININALHQTYLHFFLEIKYY